MKMIVAGLVALTVTLPVPALAQQRLSEQQLIALAVERRICGDRGVASARYVNETENRVVVICDDATGLVPLAAAGLGAGAGGIVAAGALALAAAAAGGGGGATPSTPGAR